MCRLQGLFFAHNKQKTSAIFRTHIGESLGLGFYPSVLVYWVGGKELILRYYMQKPCLLLYTGNMVT